MKKIIRILTLLTFFAAVLAAWWIVDDYRDFLRQPLDLQQAAIFTIDRGMSLTGISKRLADKGWITKPWYLAFEGRRLRLAGSIKAGEYEIQPGMTPPGVLELFVSGKVVQYSLTLPEGWTFKQIMQAVHSSRLLDRTLEDDSAEAVMKALGFPGMAAEGMFYPDTYHFPAGTTDVEFLRRSYATMQAVLSEEWRQREAGLPYRDAYEALIMASIIERETALAEEREMIAGVFVRRLERGMKLQTDPTVVYAMGGAFDGDIRQKDLSLDSPYNTYLYKGLPPTPIASPGRPSIHAALHPAPGNALYFVAMGDGRHYFSATLAEHNRAVARYQLSKQTSGD